MVGNARGIVEAVKRVCSARDHVGRSHREQGNSYQRRSYPRDARYTLLRWIQVLVPLCVIAVDESALPASLSGSAVARNQGVSAAMAVSRSRLS
jgi:hypothetical protein